MTGIRRAFVRGTAALLALSVVIPIRPATGSPGDIFSSSAPTLGSDPPKARDLTDGDSSVATQTGAYGYAYPITVPPGRKGMSPRLALSYSSQASVYSPIASGWSMSIPEIREDTSQGRLRTHHGLTEAYQSDPRADDRFQSSMAGGRPLVKVDEPVGTGVYGTYRAAQDTSYARYERMETGQPFRWRVRLIDGSIMYFGDTSLTVGCGNVRDGFAPLTRHVDPFGSEIAYEWESILEDECRIKQITWGQNANAGVASFARIAFSWARAPLCWATETGAYRDFRSGVMIVTGASVLTSITTTAHPPGLPGSPEHTRVITLGYDTTADDCNRQHAPVRLLTSIQESAWGTDAPLVALPPVTFEYGDPVVAVTSPSSAGGPPWLSDPNNPSKRYNLGWGYRRTDDRWPTVGAMMVDLDGDGRLDRLFNTSTPGDDGVCRAQWQRNMGKDGLLLGAFSQPPQDIVLPRLKWHGPGSSPPPMIGRSTADITEVGIGAAREGCSLNGQVTAFINSTETSGACHDNPASACIPQTADPQKPPGPFCYPQPMDPFGGTECPEDPGHNATGEKMRTYLAYRWMDIDGDGLTDLVSAVHGDIDTYDIVQGNRLQGEEDPQEGQPRPPEPLPFGISAWPSCPTAMDRCKELSAVEECMQSAANCQPGVECVYNWTTINTCLSTAPVKPCGELIDGTTVIYSGQSEPPPTPGLRTPYTRCEGLYPWFIFKNQGNGVFASTPTVKYQPIPLESDGGDANVTGPVLATQKHAVQDIDGDGLLDAILREDNSLFAWQVFLNDGTGGFGPKMYVFFTRFKGTGIYPSNYVAGSGTDHGNETRSSQGLFDINGDGLPEHWLTGDITDPQSPKNANLCWHNGTQHLTLGASFPLEMGHITTPLSASPPYAVRPSNDTAYLVTNPTPPPGNNHILEATTSSIGFGTYSGNRTVDVDDDGRIDVVRGLVAGETVPQVYFNVGGQFIAPGVDYPGDTAGLDRKVVGASESSELTWELKGDLIDLDGDGISESTSIDGTTFWRYQRDPALAPPRLLKAIHNGRGAHSEITYASMHDDTAVYQKPSETWPDGRPQATPLTQWVVKQVDVVDDFAGVDQTPTTAVTSYFYELPRHGADDEGRYAFRGFAQVTTTTATGAKTIHRYSYDPDWSGRLAETVVVPAEAPGDVRSKERTTWEERSLFGGAIKTYHATVTERFTCANGQSEVTCTEATAPGYTKTTATLTAFPATSSQLWHPTASLVQTGAAEADGDRRSTTTFDFFSDATTYRLLPRVTTLEHRESSAWVLSGKSKKNWDATHRVVDTEEVWFDTNDNERAIGRHVYDMTTGNVVERWKPEQHAAGNTKTTFSYDARKLFVATEVNEVGHQLDFSYDYGTGAKLQTDGPNVRGCVTSCSGPLKEQHKIRVDGLGRAIEVWDTVSHDGYLYELVQRSTASYVDQIVGGVPTSASTATLITTPQQAWRQETTHLDGHGRPIKNTVFVQGTAPADQVTIYEYRDDGTLQHVKVPDPALNDGSLVTYTYTSDSLGRTTSIRRPDHATPSQQSGIDVGYDGMTMTATEVVGAAAGSIGVTKSINDRRGRLVEVHEQTSASGPTWAVTTYEYDASDNVKTVIAADGVTTSLFHDFTGRRTKITRYGREWKYTYDKNGNVIAEQVPGSSGPLTDPDFTNTTDYDDLDRPISRMIGKRTLSEADRQQFVTDTEELWWDEGPNQKGLLTRWKAFGPTGSAIVTEFKNNALGQRTSTEHAFNDVAQFFGSRQFEQDYFESGALRFTHYRDGANAQTKSEMEYDARGLPLQMHLERTKEPVQTLAQQTRNVAGLVTRRDTYPVGSPVTLLRSKWKYDTLGRVTDQHVIKPATVVRQQLQYFGNDDPRSLTHTLGSTSHTFKFGYDLRHQLSFVSDNQDPAYFSAGYLYTGAGRLDRATVVQTIQPTPSGSDVKNRDVTYQYAGVDPEQVTALVGSSGDYASYTYDAAGNQLTRCYSATSWPVCLGESMEYVYDGKDQLRRATKKLNGTVQGSEEYWYDGAGQRIAIAKFDAGGTKTEMIWFIGDVQAHYDGAGDVTHVYSHLSMGTPVARVQRFADATTSLEYQFHGLASNTIAAVANDGTINASFSYAPFGEIIQATNAGGSGSGTAAHRRRLNDKYVDELSDLAYYGARFYDKTLIGWTQADPLYLRVPDAAQMGSPRRANLHAFSLNNPLRYVDPDGLDADSNGVWSKSRNDDVEAAWDREQGGATTGDRPVRSGTAVDLSSCSHNTNQCSYILAQDNSAAIAAADQGHNQSVRVTTVPVPEFRGELFGPVFDAIEFDENGNVKARPATLAEEVVGAVFFSVLIGEAIAAYGGGSLFVGGVVGANTGVVGAGMLGATATPAAVHGNSLLSTKAQHVYQIIQTEVASGRVELWKYGISGGKETAAGLSVRAQSQLSSLTKTAKGAYTYTSSIIERIASGAGARIQALAREKDLVDKFRQAHGQRPRGQKRP